MKRIVLFLLFACNAVSAQEKGDIEIGLGAGLNSSHVLAFNEDFQKNLIGLNVSFSAEYYFSEAWGLRLKLMYDQKGWANSFIRNEIVSNDITDFRQNYITVPFLITHHAGSKRNFFFYVGPYIGYLLGAEDEVTGLDLTFVFNRVDVGISYGIGYKLDISKHVKLFTEVEVSPGLIDIFEIEVINSRRIVNGRTSLSFGVLFEL